MGVTEVVAQCRGVRIDSTYHRLKGVSASHPQDMTVCMLEESLSGEMHKTPNAKP